MTENKINLNEKLSKKFIFFALIIFALFIYHAATNKKQESQPKDINFSFSDYIKAQASFEDAMKNPEKRRLAECLGVDIYKIKPDGWTPPTKEECDFLNKKLLENTVDLTLPTYTKYRAILCPYSLSLNIGITKQDIVNVFDNIEQATYLGCTLARADLRVYTSDFGEGLLLGSPNDNGIYPWITVKSQLTNGQSQEQTAQQQQITDNQDFKFYQHNKNESEFITISMPSFDCNKARSKPEKMICSNNNLARMDVKTANLYEVAKVISKNSKQFKKENNEAWKNRELCQSEQCIMDWYLKRDAYFSKIIMYNSLATVNFFTEGTSPVPYLRNGNDSICDSGKRNCTEAEFQERYTELKRQWEKMPEWIRKSCNTFMTHEMTVYCIVVQTGLFKAIHPYHETPWIN